MESAPPFVVAVVGGTGLIGWHAVKALKQKGHTVRVLARKPPNEALGIDSKSFFQLDLFEASDEDLDRALQGCNALIQSAGSDPRVVPKGDAKNYFFKINVDINTRLMAAAKRNGLSVAVMLTSYFHPLRPEMASHPYVASRIESEKQAMALNDEQFRVVVLQPPYVFGVIPGRSSLGDALRKATWLPLPLPKGGTNAMSATALGWAIVGAIEGEASGAYLVGDENLTWRELFKRFGGFGLPLPTFVLRLTMWFGQLALGLMRRESGLNPVALVDILVSKMHFDPKPGQAELHYQGGDLDAAIAEIRQKPSKKGNH